MNPAVGPSRFGASTQVALATFAEGIDVHVGVNLGVLDSETQFDLGTAPVSDSIATTYAVRFGILHRVSACSTAPPPGSTWR